MRKQKNKNCKIFTVDRKLKSEMIDSSRIKEICKRRFQRFCDGTSCHGFTELYRAKSPCWSIAWILILITAFSMTTYQIYSITVQFLDQPTVTVITPSKESEIYYPPMRICHSLWMFWIDWKKANDMGFDKPQILYALSYMNVIYTETKIDVAVAEKHFLASMAKNNLTTLTAFYSAIAKPLPIIAENGFATYFETIEIYFRYPGYMLCYTIIGENARKFFADNLQAFDSNDGLKVISFQAFDKGYNDVSKFLSPLEYNRYMLRWISAKSLYKIEGNRTEMENVNLLSFSPPMLFYPNGYKAESVDLFAENDAYALDMTADCRSLRNTPQNACLENVNSFASNRTCRTYCRAERDKKCTCRSLDLASLLNDDDRMDQLCMKGIYFVKSMWKPDDVFISDPSRTYANQSCPLTSPEVKSAHEKCKSACMPACRIWTWDSTVSVTSMSELVRNVGKKSVTNVTIEYPQASKVVIKSEELFATWEILLGNIGGLMGVWTGASLVSIIQFFYLCCLEDNSFQSTTFFQRKNNIQIQVLNSQPIDAKVLVKTCTQNSAKLSSAELK